MNFVSEAVPMSFQITTAFVQQYKNEVKLLVQEAGTLRAGVSEDSIQGDRAFFEQIGSIEAVERTSRHSDTPLTPHPHARRMLTPKTFEMSDLIDDSDKVRLLIDPQSPYMQSLKLAAGRQIDREIITAATGDAKTGVTGGTTTVLPTAQKVAVDFVEAGATANSGMTVGKLRETHKILREGNVDESEQLFIAVRPQQITDLLRDDEVTSSDFNVVKALVNGEINQYMGFTFLVTNLLANGDLATDVTTCFAWARSGIMLGVGKEPTGMVDLRIDKSYSTQVYLSFTVGSTRMEEEKVVQVACDESP